MTGRCIHTTQAPSNPAWSHNGHLLSLVTVCSLSSFHMTPRKLHNAHFSFGLYYPVYLPLFMCIRLIQDSLFATVKMVLGILDSLTVTLPNDNFGITGMVKFHSPYSQSWMLPLETCWLTLPTLLHNHGSLRIFLRTLSKKDNCTCCFTGNNFSLSE